MLALSISSNGADRTGSRRSSALCHVKPNSILFFFPLGKDCIWPKLCPLHFRCCTMHPGGHEGSREAWILVDVSSPVLPPWGKVSWMALNTQWSPQERPSMTVMAIGWELRGTLPTTPTHRAGGVGQHQTRSLGEQERVLMLMKFNCS